MYGDLYQRFARVQIAQNIFEYPRFELGFEINSKSGPPQAKITIHNVNDAAVRSCQPLVLPGTKTGIPAVVQIMAGYREYYGPVFLGEITGFTVKRQSTEKILTVQASDGNRLYARHVLNKTFSNMPCSSIITLAASSAGMRIASLVLAYDPLVTYTAGKFGSLLRDMAKLTKSKFGVYRGSLYFADPRLPKKTDIYVLNENSGLLSIDQGHDPKQGDHTKLTTAFLHSLAPGSVVRVDRSVKNVPIKELYSIEKQKSVFGKTSAKMIMSAKKVVA